MKTQMATRKLVEQLDRPAIEKALSELDTLIVRHGSQVAAFENAGDRKAALMAVSKAAKVMGKLQVPFGKIGRVALFAHPDGSTSARVEANLQVKKEFKNREGVTTVKQINQLLTWDWMILATAPAPVVEAPKPAPAPIPTPEAKPSPAAEAVPEAEACEGCKAHRPEFMVETMDPKGESNFARMCGACHGRAKAEKESFIDSCKIA